MIDIPVLLPPGRARLFTRPLPIGSPMVAITMGIVVVAICAARAAGVPCTTITSGFSRTSPAANAGRRPESPSAALQSMMRFLPTT